MTKTVIVDATVVDPSQGLNTKMDILVENGVITELQPDIPVRLADHVIYGRGMVVAPGFIDLHTHMREPGGEGAETIETGTRAAAKGGFTTIFCMPNTRPICDTVTGVQYIFSRSQSIGCVKVNPVAAITKGEEGEELTNFGQLHGAGVRAFSDDGRPVMNSEVMRRALEYTRMFNAPIFEHCEDLNLTGKGVMNEGVTSNRLGLKGIPRVSESTMVSRNVALAQATGGHIHISHVSTRESVEAIREAKRNGIKVTAEITPHHLTMTEKDVIGYNTLAKMKPPVCEEEDRLALVAALEDGTIDCIATDHAPHSTMSKANVFDDAPYGIIGMESAFPLLYTQFVATGRWSLEFLIEKLSLAPATVMNERWGTLKPGSAADLVMIQLNDPYIFSLEHLGSKSRNCPWLGQKMLARISATMVDGKVVYASRETFPDGVYAASRIEASATPKTPKKTTPKSTATKKTTAAKKQVAKKPAPKQTRSTTRRTKK